MTKIAHSTIIITPPKFIDNNLMLHAWFVHNNNGEIVGYGSITIANLCAGNGHRDTHVSACMGEFEGYMHV